MYSRGALDTVGKMGRIPTQNGILVVLSPAPALTARETIPIRSHVQPSLRERFTHWSDHDL